MGGWWQGLCLWKTDPLPDCLSTVQAGVISARQITEGALTFCLCSNDSDEKFHIMGTISDHFPTCLLS